MKLKVCMVKITHSKLDDKQETFELCRVKLVMFGKSFSILKGFTKYADPQNEKFLNGDYQTWYA